MFQEKENILMEEQENQKLRVSKLWIKKQNSQYVISKNDEKEILMFLTYLPMSQKMNSVLYAKYLEQILSK